VASSLFGAQELADHFNQQRSEVFNLPLRGRELILRQRTNEASLNVCVGPKADIQNDGTAVHSTRGTHVPSRMIMAVGRRAAALAAGAKTDRAK
jgi:hypothetical protein